MNMIKEIKYNRITHNFKKFLYNCSLSIHTNEIICCNYNAMNIYSYSYLRKVLLLYNIDINQMSEMYDINKKNIAILICEHFCKNHNIILSDIEVNIYTPNKIYELFEYGNGNKIQ